MAGNGRWIAILRDQNVVQVGHVDTGATATLQPTQDVQDLFFRGNELRWLERSGQQIAIKCYSCDLDGRAAIGFQATTAITSQLVRKPLHKARFVGNQLVLLISGQEAFQFELRSADTLELVHANTQQVDAIGKWMQQGDLLAVSYKHQDKYETFVWDASTNRAYPTAAGRIVDIHADGRTILLRRDRSYWIRNLANAREIRLDHGPLTARSNATFCEVDDCVVVAEIKVDLGPHIEVTPFAIKSGQKSPVERFFYEPAGPSTRLLASDQSRSGHDWETVEFSPDGRFAVLNALPMTTSGRTSRWLWDLKPHWRCSTNLAWPPASRIRALQWDQNFVLATTGEELVCSDLESRQQSQAAASATAIAVDAGAKLAATGTGTGHVQFWQLPSLRPLKTISVTNQPIRQLAFDASGQRLFILTNQKLLAPDVPRLLSRSGASMASLEFNSDSDSHLLGMKCNIGASTVTLWTGKEYLILDASRLRLLHRAHLPESFGTIVDMFAAQQDGKVCTTIPSLREGRLLLQQQQEDGSSRIDELPAVLPIQQLALDPRGQVVATCFDDGSLQFWDVRLRKPLTRLIRRGTVDRVTTMAFDTGGEELLTVGEDGRVTAWRGKF